jgi:ABC-type lipoprotein release transport system permease subunit
MSLMVSEPSREIAIRMALGSSTAAVLRLVLAHGLRLASAGAPGDAGRSMITLKE